MSTHFIEPLDILILRDNKLFGDPGSYSQSNLPPWPSVAAGALRSWLLVHDGINLHQFANGKVDHPTLGTPDQPGSFVLTDFQLARRQGGAVERFRLPPADLPVMKAPDGQVHAITLKPCALAPGIRSSAPLAQLPVLAQQARSKPESGYWLNEAGWFRYLTGEAVVSEDLVHSHDLFETELRVGIGIERTRRSVREGALFSTQTVAMRHHGRDAVGFAARVVGAELPASGMLRFGGDARGASVTRTDIPADPDLATRISTQKRARVVLTSPGIFADGWRLPGMAEDGQFTLGEVRGRIVAACVQRGQVVSGFDLAKRQPKPAQRVAPAGSVYWIEDLEAGEDALRKLAANGLWPVQGYDASRRAEGFNRFAWGTWESAQ